MKTFKKLLDIIKTVIAGEKLNGFNLTKQEAYEMRNLLSEFAFLYSHSNDADFYKSDKLKDAFENGMFYMDSFYKTNDKYTNLDKQDKLDLENDKALKITYYDKDERKKELFISGDLYSLEDDVVDRYNYIEKNTNHCFLHDFYGNRILVPTYIKKERMQNFIDKNIVVIKDGAYCLSVMAEDIIKEIKNKSSLFEHQDEFIACAYKYEEKEDGFYLIAEKNDIYQKIKDNLINPFIMDKKTLSKISYDELLNITSTMGGERKYENPYEYIIKMMRDALAHGNVVEYNIEQEEGVYYIKLFELQEKYENEDRFNGYIMCLNAFVKFLSFGNGLILNNNDDYFKFLVVHNEKGTKTNLDCLNNLKNKMFILEVKPNEEINDCVFTNFVNDIIKKYRETQEVYKQGKLINKIPDAELYFNKKIKEKFPNAEVVISKVENETLFNAKTFNNTNLNLNLLNKGYELEEFISQMFNDFYDVSCLKNKNVQRVAIKNRGIQKIMYELEKVLMYLNTIKKRTGFGAFKFEYEIFLTLLVVYVCLIKNKIVDNINRNNKKPHLDELVKGDENRSLESKIADTNMSCFTFYDINGDQTRRTPNTSIDKLNVLSWIRNGLSHNGVYLKLPLSKNVDEQVIIFESEGQEGFRNNKTDKTHIVEVKRKDLMKYFLSPIFLEFKDDLIKTVVVKTFDELIQKIREKSATK